MKSIQTKLTFTILLIFLVAMSVLGGLNYWKARNIITDNITNDIQTLSVNSAEDLSNWFESRKTELTMLASNPVLNTGNPEAIMPILAAAQTANKVYDSLVFADTTGNSWASDGAVTSVADRPFFKHVMQGETFVADPSISRGTGHLISVVAVPVKANDKIIGVLFGPVSMEKFSKKVLDIKVAQTGYAYILQQDGLSIIHPDKEVAMKVNAVTDTKIPENLRLINERIVKGERGVASYEYSGSKKFVSFAPMPGVKWFVAVTVPQNEVFGALSALTMISTVTIIVVLILTAILIVWFARRIAKPIQVLETAANRIAAGDLSQTKVAVQANDEIGRLGNSFEQMARNLRELIQKVQGATEQVSASSEQLTASSGQAAQAANQVAGTITDVATGATSQLEAVDETTTAVEQLSAEMQAVAANAGSVAATAQQTSITAQNGG